MTPDLEGKCVLVVEDDALIALGLKDLLVSVGAQVAGPFSSCAEAIAFLATNRPDVAVLDIELTDGRSYPVAEQLRNLEVGFLITSGRVVPDATISGAPFLPKPYPDATLLATLGDLVKG